MRLLVYWILIISLLFSYAVLADTGVSTNGNVSGTFIKGDGSLLTNLPAQTTVNIFDQWLNTTSDVQYGRIGIGKVPSSLYSIDANDSIRTTGSVWSDTTLRTNGIQTQSNGMDLSLYTLTTGIIKFMLGGIEQVVIDTNGNITTNGNVSGTFIKGDGSLLTNLPAQTTVNIFDQWLNTTSDVLFNSIKSFDWTNVTITESQISDLVHTVDTDTQKTTAGGYLYNDSTTIYFNDTFNNITILDVSKVFNETPLVWSVNTTANIVALGFVTGSHTVDTDTQKTTAGNYLYNDSMAIYFNDTFNNITIRNQINNSDLNISHLKPIGSKGNIIYGTTTGWSILTPAGIGTYKLQSINNALSWILDTPQVPDYIFKNWASDNGGGLVTDMQGDTVTFHSPDGSINDTTIPATDTVELQLGYTLTGNEYTFNNNISIGGVSKGQLITLFTNAGANCTTMCNGLDGAPTASYNWACIGKVSLTGVLNGAGSCGATTNSNCACQSI